MKKTTLLMALAGGISIALAGCADLVKELKEDPAILGTTGFYVSIGFDPSPQNSFFPLPHVKLGHGAAWRVGTHDCVYITTAAGASASAQANPAGQSNPPGPKNAVVEAAANQENVDAPKEDPSKSGDQNNRAPCIPSTTVANPQLPQQGAAAIGQAYLTISASGLETLKARWTEQAELKAFLKEKGFTDAEITTILQKLNISTPARTQ